MKRKAPIAFKEPTYPGSDIAPMIKKENIPQNHSDSSNILSSASRKNIFFLSFIFPNILLILISTLTKSCLVEIIYKKEKVKTKNDRINTILKPAKGINKALMRGPTMPNILGKAKETAKSLPTISLFVFFKKRIFIGI